MKFYLIIVVFAIFVLLGVFIYFRYYFRHQLYKDLCYICKHLKNNITFKKDKLDVLLNDAYSNISTSSRNLLTNIKGNTSLIYKKDDVVVTQKFISSLGKGNVDYEMNNLNYYENNFEESRKVAKENLNKNGTMYIKLMIGIGLAVCIMLL